jgi:hypothetical protein
LEFSGLAKSYLQLKPYLETYLLKGFTVGTTGKSLAIRTRVPELDFMSDFSLQNDVVHQCLESVREMYVVMNKIDLNKVFEG